MRKQRHFIIVSLVFFHFAIASPLCFGNEQYQQGAIAFAGGDYRKAAELWLIESYEGHALAQFNLGVLYSEGKGVQKSRRDAIYWFTESAKQGHVEAQYNLGHLLMEELENPESVKLGIGWWRRAAEQGFSIAQFNYGKALFYGIGVQHNLANSRYWMEQSAAAGEAAAVQFLQAQAEVFAKTKPEKDVLVTAKADSTARQPDVAHVQDLVVTKQPKNIPETASEPIIVEPEINVATRSKNVAQVPESGFVKQSQSIPQTVPAVTNSDNDESAIEFKSRSLTVDEFVAYKKPQQTIKNTLSTITSESPKSSSLHNDNHWLFANPAEAVTWELIRITDRKTTLRLFDTVKNQAQLFSMRSGDRRWYSILMGSYQNQATAETNRKWLPAWAGNAKIKSFEALQKNRCEISGQLDNYERIGLSKLCHT